MDITNLLKSTADASRSLIQLDEGAINKALIDLAEAVVSESENIIASNKLDLDKMLESDPRYDRLLLNKERIIAIANDIKNVATLTKPCGETLEEKILPNGLKLTKKRVPLGVIGVIYEARPNVTLDVFSLCLKSQNGCILKGGSDAEESNKILTKIIKQVLKHSQISSNIVQLLPADREAAKQLMKASEFVDVLIPRGSSGLINFVRENSSVPVIETGAGIVHAYFDKSGDFEKGIKVITNAKTRRVSVCNALDSLIIHKNRLTDLPKLSEGLADAGVIIYADAPAFIALKDNYPENLLKQANTESFGTEFLSLAMSIKTVATVFDALEHINKYSSKHSEVIIAEDLSTIELYTTVVDAAAVYVNASTAFTDGAQFGLGTEIGISTQKLHARGPMGLKELTSYKWIVQGNGHTRL